MTLELEFEQFKNEVVDYYGNQGLLWVFRAHSNPHVYIGYTLTELGEEPFPRLLCYKVAYWVGEEKPWRFTMGESTRSSFHSGQTLEEADTKAWNGFWVGDTYSRTA